MEQVDTRRAISHVLCANAHIESYLYFRNTYFALFYFMLSVVVFLSHTLFHIPGTNLLSLIYEYIYVELGAL